MPYRFKHCSFFGDSLAQPLINRLISARRKRMSAPGLRKSLNEFVVASFKKNRLSLNANDRKLFENMTYKR